MRWSLHLDLTTDSTQFRAYIYSAPTLVDLDGDGSLEIIVGTSVGFIYVLSADGKVALVGTAHAFATPTLVDLDGDRSLEIIVGTAVEFIDVLSAGGEACAPGLVVPWCTSVGSSSCSPLVRWSQAGRCCWTWMRLWCTLGVCLQAT